jgi:hypothetical protein
MRSMNADLLKRELETRGMRLSVDRGKLAVDFPKGVLDEATRRLIRDHKKALLEALHADAPRAAVGTGGHRHPDRSVSQRNDGLNAALHVAQPGGERGAIRPWDAEPTPSSWRSLAGITGSPCWSLTLFDLAVDPPVLWEKQRRPKPVSDCRKCVGPDLTDRRSFHISPIIIAAQAHPRASFVFRIQLFDPPRLLPKDSIYFLFLLHVNRKLELFG